MMRLFKNYISFLLLFLFHLGCQTKTGESSDYKTLHLADLKNIDYLVSDTTLKITENNIVTQINYITLDSAMIGNSKNKMYTIGVESFSKETPDQLKEKVALTIGYKLGASQIAIMKDRESYVAHITSGLSGGGGKEIEKLLQENWEFNYILK